MKYYEDDYDTEETESAEDETVRRPEVQLESLRGLDWLIAVILAGVTGGLLTLWAFPGLSPDAWEDVAIGAELRPMKDIFPGFWNAIARGLNSWLGVSSGVFLLKVLGRVIAGTTVGLVYLLLRQILSITIRVRLQFSRRRFFVVRGVALLGALFFACSDPVWRAGQTFTPPLLLLFMTVLVLTLFFGFLMSGGIGQIYFSMFLLGLLSAETPMGFFLLALVWGTYLLALRHGAVSANSPLLNPVVEQSSKWHLTFLYALGLVTGVGVNCYTFIAFGGLDVFAKVGADMPLMYATLWWTQFINAASGMGWVLGLGIGVLPFVVSAVLLPRAVDEEQFLPYHMGAVFFVAGALSFAQLAELPPLWFWTWSYSATINSPYFLLVLMLFSAASVVFALAVMAVDICCRDHQRLATQRFAELREEAGIQVDADEARDVKPLGAGARVVLVIVPLLLLAGVVPGRHLGQTRRKLEIIDAYAKEVLAECHDGKREGVKWIFTDGKFDPYLELLAASEGRRLYALSLIRRNASLDMPREKYMCARGVTNDEESRHVMNVRWWVKDHPERLAEVAFQIGFEVWRREGKSIPPVSGVLARPIGMSEEARLNGVAVATNLASRILDVYKEGSLSKNAGLRINDLFESVQWRLARLARLRADYAGRMKMKELALREKELSEKLDGANESFKRIMRDMEAARARTLNAVTPRESLQGALQRRDFAIAAVHAELIRTGNPADADANWAIGMNYFEQKQWALAEEFLKKCCEKRPKEPVYWNNLAMICLFTGRYDEGLKLANRALALIPDSDEVRDTIARIQEAKKESLAKTAAGKSATKAPSSVPSQATATRTPPSASAKPPVAEKPTQARAPDKPSSPALRMAPTPREELDAAIARGDYAAAAQYAQPVLSVTPDDPYANFAVGMDHFGKRAWEPAEKYLRRCVEQKPDEPVFLNNLAIVLLYRGRYDDALAHARRALEVLPSSADIQNTIHQIEKAREAAGAEKKSKAKPAAKKKNEGKKPEDKKPTKKDEKPASAPQKPPAPAADEPSWLDGLVPSLPDAPASKKM